MVEHRIEDPSVLGSIPRFSANAEVAKLVDALDLGSSVLYVRVRVSPSVPFDVGIS